MKIREKIIAGYVVTSLAFLLLTFGILYIASPQFLQPITMPAYLAFLIWGTVLSISWIALLYIFIIKKMEATSRTLANINRKNNFSERFDTTGDDELASINEDMNKILELAEESHDRLELRIQARTIKLEKRIEQLEKEVSDHEYVKKNLLTHNQNLIRLSRYDNLTGLPNRILFNETLSQTITQTRIQRKLAALLIIDFCNFKDINESLGHANGDLVLKEIGRRLKTMVREVDLLARIGGAEFGILLNDIVHTEFAKIVAEKIVGACENPIEINNRLIHVSVNIGISLAPNDGLSLEPLLKNADTALYKAKLMGKGTFQFFTKEMGQEVAKINKFESALQSALKNNEFILNYQPILSLSDGQVTGIEALVRWESPVLGQMNPGRFISLAEEAGIIMELGEWILTEACRINKSWQNKGYKPLPISVNLSSDQFKHQDLVSLVKNALEKTQLEPKYLLLEIESSIIMDNIENSEHILKSLNDIGIKIVIDKFGSGSTSISFLKKLSIEAIKINQDFILEIPEHQNNADITQTIITLVKNLGLKTIATGIETNEQLKYLADRKCDLGQGYLFSKPVSESNFVASYFNPVDDKTTSKI